MAKYQKHPTKKKPKSTNYIEAKRHGARAIGIHDMKSDPLMRVDFVTAATDVISYSGSVIIADNAGRPEWPMSSIEKMDMAKSGVTKEELETLKSKTDLDYDKLSTILSTTRATLIKKKGKDRLSPTISERIVSIADLYSYGFEVFEDDLKFKEWIFRPNKALGGKQPFELLNNQFGREEVKNLIGRIDYGVYS